MKETILFKAFVIQTEVLDTIRKIMSKRYIQFLLLAMMVITCFTPVFATDIFSDMATSLTEAYESFIPVVNICALIFAAIAGVAYMFPANEKGAETAKKWLWRIGIGWVIISVFPYILIQGRNLLGDSVKGKSINDIKDIKPGS